MKKKITFIIPSLKGGGAERVMVNILRNINKDLFEVSLVIVQTEGVYFDLLPNDIIVRILNVKRVRYSIRKLIKVLNELKPDIVFSTLGHLSLALLGIRFLLRTNPKIVIREANTPSMFLNSLEGVWKKKLYKMIYSYYYSKADLIVAQCKEMKEDILITYNIHEDKVDYIYNPIDNNYIKNEISSDNPYDEKKTNMLAVGRLTPQKGFDVLIESFSILLNSIPHAHLTILGEGELLNELKQRSKELQIENMITFKGFVENPYNYYYYCDLYVLSSRWEGFPNTLLEALACDAKVVATNCKSGTTEILMQNIYGELVDKENSFSLFEGMLQALNGENKSQNRSNDFDISKVIKQYEQKFSEI